MRMEKEGREKGYVDRKNKEGRRPMGIKGERDCGKREGKERGREGKGRAIIKQSNNQTTNIGGSCLFNAVRSKGVKTV